MVEPSVFPSLDVPPEAEVLCESPLIYTIDGFLSAAERARFRECADGRLRRAQVVPGGSDDLTAPRAYSEGRTNSNCWVSRHDPVLAAVEQRVCAMLRVPGQNSEHFQVIQYAEGQKYAPHMDTHAETTDETPGGQRLVTCLLYLNDVEEGGTTDFVKLGLSVAPKAGRLLCFHNCSPGTNVPDPRTLHTGSAVVAGEKWAVNKWIRERRIRLNYEQESDPSAVHLGMDRAELLELIDEMTLEDVQATLEEEAVRLPEAGEGRAVELSLEGQKALLRAHLGVD